jgi:hypothetical protein
MRPQGVAALSWPYGKAGITPQTEVNGKSLVYDDGGVEICR